MSLQTLIRPEIINDALYRAINRIASMPAVKTILEVGSSSGEGSTRALIEGASKNGAVIYAIEVSEERFLQLNKIDYIYLLPVRASSVPELMSKSEVIDFYTNTKTNLNNYPIDRVLGWLKQDVDYIEQTGVERNGIQKIKQRTGIAQFDMAVVDGSAFSGSADLELLYGSRFIVLDDINDIKNYHSHHRLKKDLAYKMIEENYKLRNGYSIFERV